MARAPHACSILAALVLALSARMAAAGGFFVQEEAALGLGRAHAGNAASADSPEVLFYNPAGMTELEPRLTVQSSLYGIFPQAEATNNGSRITTPGTFGEPVPVTGNNGGNPYGPTPLANLYIAGPIPGTANSIWAGFGVTSPFGLAIDYRFGWFGRYDSTRSVLKTFNFAPSVAFKITDWLSFGGSVDVEYARALLEQAVPNPAQPGGPTALGDGRGRVKGDDTSVGFTLGVLVTPFRRARVGVGWRWGISHHLTGALDVSGFTGIARPANQHVGGSADLDEPNIVSVAGTYQLSSRLTLLGSVNYYGWHTFTDITIRPIKGDNLVDPQKFDDSYAPAVGFEYQLTDALRLRTGFQYDHTPTVHDFRNTRIPDADRYLLGIGATYRLTDHFEGTVGYLHVFVNDVSIQRTRTIFPGTPLATVSTTRVTGTASVDVVGVSMVYRF